MTGQRVLVTGASGFIGAHLCRRLCSQGAEVHGISRMKQPDEETGVRWWQGDVAETATVQEAVTTIKPHFIFHLAGQASAAREREQVLPTFRNNLMSTVNLLTAASEIGCRRIVLAGSLEEPEPVDGSPVPSSPYAASKWAASRYARMFHVLYRLDVVVLRVFMVYGPAQADVKKLIPYVILCLLRGESPRLGNGQRQVDWVYVEDVVAAFLAAALADGIAGETVDVGSGKLVSIRTIVERLGRLVNPQIKLQFGSLPKRPLEQVRVANVEPAYNWLGWKAATSLEEGLKQTVQWYTEQHKQGIL